MYVGSDFQPSDVGENEVYSFDFVNDVGGAETLSSATFTLAVATGSTGTDPNPSSHLIGSAVIFGTVASQRISGLLNGVTYVVAAVSLTSLGNTISLWSHIPCDAPA